MLVPRIEPVSHGVRRMAGHARGRYGDVMSTRLRRALLLTLTFLAIWSTLFQCGTVLVPAAERGPDPPTRTFALR